MNNDMTTDAHGETLDQVVEVAQDTANRLAQPVAVGRIYMSARRWIWGERFDGRQSERLDDGSRWEPVRTVEPR